jgi:hypothetical protein
VLELPCRHELERGTARQEIALAGGEIIQLAAELARRAPLGGLDGRGRQQQRAGQQGGQAARRGR